LGVKGCPTPVHPVDEAEINELLGEFAIPGRVSATTGVLTFTTVANGHC